MNVIISTSFDLKRGTTVRKGFVLFSAALVLIALAPAALAQDKLLTIDDIFDPVKRVNFNGSPPFGLTWLKDGTHYLQAKVDQQTRSAQLLRVDALTGESAPFFDSTKMEAALVAIPGFSTEDAKRLSHRGSYQMNESRTAVLLNHANDLFYYEFGSDKAVRLTNTPEEEVGEEFSPDSKMVSFVRNNNLSIVDVATQRERALTGDGGPKILNGRLN